MNYIITDEELHRFTDVFSKNALTFSSLESRRAALADFLNNRPALVATLRPIAEMSEKPAQGATRMYGFLENGPSGTLKLGDVYVPETDSVFVDMIIPTAPDPETDLRREFEEAMKAKHPSWDLKRDSGAVEYNCGYTQSAWDGFKLAKGAKP